MKNTYQDSINYWNNILSQNLEKISFPYDYYEGDEYLIETHRFILPATLFEKLNKISKESDSMLFSLVAAGLISLLHKYTRKEEILFSIPFYSKTNTTDIINPALPIIIEFNCKANYKDILFSLTQKISESNTHKNCPLDKIIKQNNYNDIFSQIDVAICSNNTQNENFLSKIKPNFIFNYTKNQSDIEVEISYNSLVYQHDSIIRISSHFLSYIEILIEYKDKPIINLPFISEKDKELIMDTFNNTRIEYPKDKSIHQLFEEQVINAPSGIALVNDSVSLTYKDLNEKSNQLAHYLLTKNIKQNEIVGLLTERSVETIIGFLAILKVGGCVLPIDSSLPLKRKEYILKDSQAKYLLLDNEDIIYQNISIVKDISFNNLINIQDTEIYNQMSFDNIENVRTSDFAYILYTSGSTGNPKGVIIAHKNIINYLTWAKDNYITNNCSTFPLHTSISFDLTITSIFLPLITGNKIYIYPDTKEHNILDRIFSEDKVDVIKLTPSHLQIVAERQYESRNLKSIIVGGEKLTTKLANTIHKQFGSKVEIYNEYGPTEATVGCMLYKYEPDKNQRLDSVLIGKPSPNCQIFILDEFKNMLPFGVSGEMYIGGDQLFEGYLSNVEMTNEKLTSLPFVNNRLFYKTGDIAKMYEDGNILFIGRIDEQVKIRGFRIELGEIENQLLIHEMVSEVAIIAKENEGDKTLIAYYVSAKELEVLELRNYLSQRLPDYMIPSFFVHMNTLPLTQNGKVDKKALPDPEITAGNDYIAPKNQIEEKLVGIWSSVLQIQKECISINRNFFEIGGNSLLSLILMGRINKEFEVNIPLSDFFDQPRIKELSASIRTAKRSAFVPIIVQLTREYYTLSSAQKRLYFLYSFSPKSTAYNMPSVHLLKGDLDLDRLEEVFIQLIDRHEVLRTSIHVVDNEPMQKIHMKVDFHVDYYEAADQADVDTITRNFIRPFDLSSACYLRVGVIKTISQENILIRDMHHIISDGISDDILTQDFMRLMRGEALGTLPLQYKDYAEWQQSEDMQSALCTQRQFWQGQIGGELPLLELPYDYPRPAVQGSEGDALRFSLSKEESAALKKLAKEERCTLFMTLLACFNILLFKLSGQDDIIVGTPIAGRRHPDLEGIVGMFVNTLALRNYTDGEKNLRTFLQDVRKRCIEGFENQDYQFEDLVEQVNVGRNTGRNPIFDVMFTLQSSTFPVGTTGLDAASSDGIKASDYSYETSTAKFDLMLNCFDSDECISCSIGYSTALFKKETILRFAAYFRSIVNKLTRDLDLPLKELSIVPDTERKRILEEFNNTRTDYPRDKSIVKIFEEQAGKTPDSIAIVFNNEYLTYGVLNAISNRLANHFLQCKNIQANDLIALMLDRSEEVLIAVLAIMKSGAAYVPIDPIYPQNRIELMLNDCEPKLILTHSKHSSRLISKSLVLIDKTSLSAFSQQNLNVEISSRDLAYVMYTSGSTGIPKGTMIEHRSVVRLVKNTNYIDIKPIDRILQTGAPVFDATTFEYWGVLLNGATLHLVPDQVLLSTIFLKDAIIKNKISIMWLTAGLFNALVEQDCKMFCTLTHLLVGGDILSPKYINKTFRESQNLSIINGYGPTENTTFSTTFSIKREFDTSIPIGKPVANTTAYILDKYFNPQPIGVEGELFFGGDGVARSYLNREGLMLEKFIESPFITGDRLYRTGDFARWLSDGNIEFLGRKDNQIKLRGYRIEMGEIESAFLKHLDLNEVVVEVKEKGGGNYLCIYYTSNAEVNVQVLREYAVSCLPEYMVPSYFIQLEKIPLTPNGKVDKFSLPVPDFTPQNGYTAPTNPTEQRLVCIWSELLKLPEESISTMANFFELGGHSLLSITLIGRISKEFEVNIPLADFFKQPNVKYLSNVIEAVVHLNTKKVAFSSNNIEIIV